MDNVVTHETAQRLKEAGFPQPEPAPGQYFYHGDRDFIVLDFYTTSKGVNIVDAVELYGNHRICEKSVTL